MSAITREQFDAKIEAIEARMDARVELSNAKADASHAKADATHARLDSFIALQAERDRRFFDVQAERDKRLDALPGQITSLALEMRAGFSSLRTTILVTAITATIAIVLGVASFNASLTSNMLAAFQLGESVQPALASLPIAPAATQPNAD